MAKRRGKVCKVAASCKLGRNKRTGCCRKRRSARRKKK